MPQIQLIQSCTVRRQAVSRDRLRLDWLVVQRTSEKPQRRLRIASPLDYGAQNLALVVDRSPQIRPLAPISSKYQRSDGAPRRFFSRLSAGNAA
jgi:hypothetical protein